MGKRMEEAVRKYHEIQEKNLLGGGARHMERQHSRGKLSARERIEALVDPGSFRELGSSVGTTSVRIDGQVPEAPCDGAVVGTARVNGRMIMVHASDFTVLGGSVGAQHMLKFSRPIEMAAMWRIPYVILLDSSGGRLGYRDVPMAGIDWQFRLQSIYSGVIPQITVLMGPCIAGGAYIPALCDFLIISRNSGNMWLGGPRQTQAATSEVIDRNVGGADYHMELSGTCDLVGDGDEESIVQCRELLSYLPQSFREAPPRGERTDDPEREVEDLSDLVPDEYEKTYDMHNVIERLVDNGDYLEIKDRYAMNLITCFCRFDGRVVGLVANNPIHPGSTLNPDCCDKYYRFLQALDAYNIPLVNIVDTPPLVPGEQDEARGLIRHVGKIADVYATATVPKISVILREAYADAGGMIMGGLKSMGADLVYAWPIARFGIEASQVDYRKVYGKGVEEEAYEAYMGRSREKVDVFEAGRTWTAQVLDEIILPKDTRKKIVEALEITARKEEAVPERAKNHGVPPV
ncbi:MAG: propionyl-CoA carboxylase [Deltaproteobacteria bacterium]|nr:propionyl-CoA carboxylase [Deltaproteobacteria bacterium]MBW2048242.1 propionyl-CoA carboxylase [Deltaproteobacteria bacterium]MBW2111352.1 propionyl-CoA carboxylase [Deltaproteobacteria bacterium]MBW2352894.1 propionyl-CoA carboxylase [Deltaproteobacteria bacterium]HDZ91565.1 propionyl-CoA carboxylase [Deltaproteobacteria bacterium]